MKSIRKITKNEKGSTLVSVIISAAVVSALVVGSYSSLTQVKEASEFNTTGTSLCRLAAQNILSSIRSSGGATKVFKSPINNSSISLSDSAWHTGDNSYGDDGIQNENGLESQLNQVRWPNRKVVDWSSGLPAASNAPKAVYSYMNALATIYFYDNSVCTDPNGISLSDLHVDSWGPGGMIEGFQVESSLRIRPFDLRNGNYSCGLTINDWPRPFAQQEPPLAVQDDIISLNNYSARTGFEVEASIRLTRSKSGTGTNDVYDCSLTEKFSYDVQKERVPVPIIQRVGPNLTVSLPANRYNFGSYLLCRAESYINPGLNRGVAISRRARLVRGPGEGWRPCDQVTNICSQNLGPAQINNAHTSVEISAPTVPNCAYEYQAITVDAAGNRSLTASLSGYDGITSPVPNSPSDRDGSPGPSFSVDGVNYATQAAAQVAADLSGLPMQPIPSPPSNPRDIEFNTMNNARSSAFSSYNSAQTSATSAQSHASSAQTRSSNC